MTTIDKIAQDLEENGLVVIENFLTEDEVNELKEAGNQLCLNAPKEERRVFSTLKQQSFQSRDKYFLESSDKICYFFEEDAVDENGDLKVDPLLALNKVGHFLHVEIESFKKVTYSDPIKDVCKKLGFRKPALPQSMYIYKNPGVGGVVTPHQDATFLYTEPHSCVGFWIPIDDATEKNGCLQFVRGSNKTGLHRRYIRNPDCNSNELLLFDVPARTYEELNFEKAPVKKGSLVLIHGQVVHQSDHNKSQKSRHAYTFHVIETDKTKWSEQNWLQPKEGKEFPLLEL